MPLLYEQQQVILIVVTLFLAAVITLSELRAARSGRKIRSSVRFWNVSALLILSGCFVFVVTSKQDSDEFMPKCARAPDPVYLKNHLKDGGNPNTRDAYSGDTLLMIAARNGNHRVVRCLLAYGADPTLENPKGQTAWDIAREARLQHPQEQAKYEDIIAMLRVRTRMQR